MDINTLEESLELMSEQALSRFAKRCFCLSLYNESGGEELGIDVHIALDMVYAECTRRGIERLYDAACESVNAHPEVCSAA
ncbi:MAG: hypothetical protein GXP08_05065 [Gammaproteobacteria bacterium]|nr:hypothetical protein [Gammaproteobacteria bacterium]